MKTRGWKNIGTSLALTFLVASAAHALPVQKPVWLARSTGLTQCVVSDSPPELGVAVDQLERIDAVVLVAKLGALTDRAFCTSCSCERNLFHVAKVSAEPETLEIALRDGWIAVDPENVAAPSLPELAVDSDFVK